MAGVCRRARRGVVVGSSKGSPGGQTADSMGERGEAGGAGRRVLFARGTSRSQFGSSMTFRGEERPIPECSSAKKRTEWQIRCRDPCCWVSCEAKKSIFAGCCSSYHSICIPTTSLDICPFLPQLAWQSVYLPRSFNVSVALPPFQHIGNLTAAMSSVHSASAAPRKATIWEDIKAYRKAYWLTAVASFGGMLFG